MHSRAGFYLHSPQLCSRLGLEPDSPGCWKQALAKPSCSALKWNRLYLLKLPNAHTTGSSDNTVQGIIIALRQNFRTGSKGQSHQTIFCTTFQQILVIVPPKRGYRGLHGCNLRRYQCLGRGSSRWNYRNQAEGFLLSAFLHFLSQCSEYEARPTPSLGGRWQITSFLLMPVESGWSGFDFEEGLRGRTTPLSYRMSSLT